MWPARSRAAVGVEHHGIGGGRNARALSAGAGPRSPHHRQPPHIHHATGREPDGTGVRAADRSGTDGPCGDDEGAGELGRLKGISGALECVGGFDGTTETCNGIDDDCDGEVDEGDLCEGGVCVDGECSAPCEPGEFGCPVGQMCVDGFCLDDPCFDVQCPDGPAGEMNVCVDGLCVAVCDTLECPGELVCRVTDGLCVPDNCNFLDLCADDELCVDELCVSDPCADVSCGEHQFCRAGACVDSCGGVECEAGFVCADGSCQPTGCAADCAADEICNPATGVCDPNPCDGEHCGVGKACDPSTGDCIDDPCIGIECPGQEVCWLGNCFDRLPGDEPDAGPPAEYVTPGGGGCSTGGTGGAALAALALLVLGLARGRRRALRGVGLLAMCAALLAAGCDVREVCVTCGEGHGGDDDGGATTTETSWRVAATGRVSRGSSTESAKRLSPAWPM